MITASYTKRELQHEELSFFCVFGKNGVSGDKQEGDYKTPLGIFPLLHVYYRGDRIEKPKTILPCTALDSNDAWCDDPQLPEYNSFIKLPFAGSHENLWREDELYDIIVVLQYNMEPAIPGRGSAIFLHCMKEDMQYTKGCIAIGKGDLLALLSKLPQNPVLCISE